MEIPLKRDVLYLYAQKLMDFGIEVTAHAHVEIGTKWAREPKVIALTLLCRTLGNMKVRFYSCSSGCWLKRKY